MHLLLILSTRENLNTKKEGKSSNNLFIKNTKPKGGLYLIVLKILKTEIC
jgi:hypothetical protein